MNLKHLHIKYCQWIAILLVGVYALFSNMLSAQDLAQYHVGDIYTFNDGSKGVVCYVDPTNPGRGWAVALKDLGTMTKTSDNQKGSSYSLLSDASGVRNISPRYLDEMQGFRYVPYEEYSKCNTTTNPNTITSATGSYSSNVWVYEGNANTRAMMRSGYFNSTLANEIDTVNGWYIPDIMQLSRFFSLLPVLKDSIESNGGLVPEVYKNSSTFNYWSSSRLGLLENNRWVAKNSVWAINFTTRETTSASPTAPNCIRLVRDFNVNEPKSYWVNTYSPKTNVKDTITGRALPLSGFTTPNGRDSVYTYYLVAEIQDTFFRYESKVIVHPTYNRTIKDTTCQSSELFTSTKENRIFKDIDVSVVDEKNGAKVPTWIKNKDNSKLKQNIQSQYGCDSIINLELLVYPSYLIEKDTFVCVTDYPCTWRGKTLDKPCLPNETVVYWDSLKTHYGCAKCGCDSIYKLNLTVVPLPTLHIMPEDTTVCRGEEITLTVTGDTCFDYSVHYDEDFSKITTANSNEISPSTDISSFSDLFVDGRKIFEEGAGIVKLGKSNPSGIYSCTECTGALVTKPLALNEAFSITLGAKGRNNGTVSSIVRVSFGGQSDTRIISPGIFEEYTWYFDGEPGTNAITIETLADILPGNEYSEARVVIDYVRIRSNRDCSYTWTDEGGVEIDPDKVIIDGESKFYVEAVSTHGCRNIDSVTVKVYSPIEVNPEYPDYIEKQDTAVCYSNTDAPVTTIADLESLGFEIMEGHNNYIAETRRRIGTSACEGGDTTIYVVMDECGNDKELMYIQPVRDTIAPVITGTLDTITIEEGCGVSDIPLNYTYKTVAALEAALRGEGAGVEDNCTTDFPEENISVKEEVNPSSCGQICIRKYVVRDACDNVSDTVTQVILIRVPNFTLNPLLGRGTVTCIDDAVAPSSLPTVTNKCGDVLDLVPVLTIDTAMTGCEGSITYTYAYTDCAGHTNNYVYTYKIRLPETIAAVPESGSREVPCAVDAVKPGAPTIQDVCGRDIVPVYMDSMAVITDGSGTVTHRYRYSDCDGNDSTWVFVYTVNPASFTPVADKDSTVKCLSQVLSEAEMEAFKPTVTACGEAVPVALDSVRGHFTQNCGDSIYFYHYEVNSVRYTWKYTFHVVPDDFTVPADSVKRLACMADAIKPIPPTVTDYCGNAIVPGVAKDSLFDGCEGTVVYSFTHYCPVKVV